MSRRRILALEEDSLASKKTQDEGAGEKSTDLTPPGLANNNELSALSQRSSFPVVGVGASAGGLEALEEFFDHLPADCAIAFVIVTHQLRSRVSLLPELVSKHTSLPTCEVRQELEIEPGRIYFARPGETLELRGQMLRGIKPADGRKILLPIDQFFRSLAREQRGNAIGIVLSGTGSDGTLGLMEIKGAAGMVMVQEEATARFSGMPHSAIATRMVDYVLPARELPSRLLAYTRGELDGPATQALQDSKDLRRIFVLLLQRTGHDFSLYKTATLLRRLGRRMNVHHIKEPERYADLLAADSAEVDILFKELLIGVTSFFRDPPTFKLLKSALHDRLANAPKLTSVRVWVAGCSTGEEACSIAILLREVMEELDRNFSVQIFATDLDGEAIDVARRGVFLENIAVDVSAERLKRFFTRDGKGYRLNRELRDMIIFARQNLLQDPPFTKLDLLSCRNLLIYLDAEAQRRLLPVFHYALKPEGLLLLGCSESVAASTTLFRCLDKKARLFRSEAAESPRLELRASSFGLKTEPGLSSPLAPPGTTQAQDFERLMLRQLPPNLLVHERGDVVHIHGRTGQFLEPAPGPQTNINVLDMTRPGLKLELAAALSQAAKLGEWATRGVRVKSNGDGVLVDLRVTKLEEPASLRGLFQITFDKARPPSPEQDGRVERLPVSRILELEREMLFSKEAHLGTIEELEAANEELKSTNEELQSTNEELQSANEELETSKEELQSLNEELQTVNSELQDKVEELSRTNDDMKNLLDGTDIATLFLDAELRIKRFTDSARKVISLISSDVGRPISDLVPKLHYDSLVEDASRVLIDLAPKESEVLSESGAWYQVKILPYRTTEELVNGLVITFVDITRIKALTENKGRIKRALTGSPTVIFGQDLELRYQWGASAVFGITPDRLVGRRDAELLPAAQAQQLDALKRAVIDSGEPARERVSLIADGRERIYDLYITPARNGTSRITGILCVMTDMSGAGPP